MSPTPSRDEKLFADAIARPAHDRAAFLDGACNGDAVIRARILALIAAHEGPESLMAAPALARPAELPDLSAVGLATADEQPGDWIGRYKLLQQIGEGGCGVVWMAEQEEPVRRRVALKVIKLGMDTKAVVARFEAERQALAMMDHANIAKVHDAGATETGRPFFVMELVRGIPITKYCDENHLTPTARLELFIKVCHAIQHAHQKGVIHRDIKPSNILVTVNDGAATPKVIDFGIAKATQGKLTDATVFTAFEQFIGTPVYMSPEQAEMSSLDIDTRSDIYSLGVLLYELLTGRPPFDPKVFAKAGVDQIRQQIREVEPQTPSRRLHTLEDDERTTIAKLRNTAPAQLSLLLRGDLDWIVMRCLEKDRTRRYDTANGLAMDIQRHLRNEPVTARPPSTAYLLQKLIRRNRVAFVGGVAVASVLVVGAIVSTWQAVRATQAEREESRLRIESDESRERAVASEKAERQLRERAVEEQQLGLKRSSRADFKLASRLLDEGNAGEGLAYLVRAARSDPQNSVVGPRLISALVTRNFLLPDRAPLKLPAGVKWISCTADGSAVWILGEDGVIRVLDGAGSRVMREFSFPRKVLHVVPAANNRGIFAVYLDDHSLLVCDAATGRTRTPSIRPGKMLLRKGFPLLSADGRWLAAASDGEVWIWDAATGELRATLPHPGLKDNEVSADPGNVSGLDFSPDGRWIATTALNNYVRIWSVPDGAPLTDRLPSGDPECVGVQFSPDGRLIVVNTFTGAQIRDAKTGAQVGPFLPHDAPCDLAFFTADGRRVITTSGDRTVKVWHVATGQLALPALLHGGPFPAVHHGGPLGRWSTIRTSDDGKVLLTTCADGFTRGWDLDNGQLLAEPALQQEKTPHSALSPDGTHVFVGTAGGLVFPLRLERGFARPLVLPRGSGFVAVGLEPEAPARLRRFSGDRLEIIDVASGREVAGGFAFPEPVNAGGYLRTDGRFLAVRTKALQHQVWEVIESQVRVVALQDAPNGGASCHFSAVGDLLAMVGSGSREIRVWNLHTGRPVTPPMTLDAALMVFSPSFSPDGKRLAAGDIGGTVRVWNVATGRALFDLKPFPAMQVNRVTFSPDGTRLATTTVNGEVRLWDGATGQPVSSVLHHRIRADPAAFSPDSRTLATSSHDGTARVWDARDGTPIGEPMVHPGLLNNVHFNADGSRIATVSGDGTGRVWDTRTGLPLTDAMRHNTTLEWYDLVQASNGQFSPGDGRFMYTFSSKHVYLWAVPPEVDGAPALEWLLRLATICAGKRVTADGVLADASDEVAKIDEVRREIAALPVDAPFAEWGKWFFADRATRSMAPGFTLTAADAERLAVALKQGNP
ncbi:MAG: protein kinase [Opitutaceae bacterium]|nr:protein kinase [Opitutaceae bacterium]